MEIRPLYVKGLQGLFHFEQVAGDVFSLEREIKSPEVNRPGFELAGFYKHSDSRRLIVMGDKEIAFINQLPENEQNERFDFLTADETPAIIIAKGHKCPDVLKEIANKKNFPIFVTDIRTGSVLNSISNFLAEKLDERTSVHASFISIYNKGVLIMGESGIGKSEITLELINRGHRLVADDNVDLHRIRDGIMGKAPKVLEHMLEIRGVGILNVFHMFGVGAVLDKAEVDFVIHLKKWSEKQEYKRVDMEDRHEYILGIKIPNITLPVSAGRNMSVVIEAAVRNHRLKETGYDSDHEFMERVREQIVENQNDRKEGE